MPLLLLFALFLAFGLETSEPFAPLSKVELGRCATIVVGLVGLVALASVGVGLWVSSRVARAGYASLRLRRGLLLVRPRA